MTVPIPLFPYPLLPSPFASQGEGMKMTNCPRIGAPSVGLPRAQGKGEIGDCPYSPDRGEETRRTGSLTGDPTKSTGKCHLRGLG